MEWKKTGVNVGKKFIPVVTLIALFLVPLTSFGLGLGPITMRSALNQPLLAEIDIHSVQPGDLDGLAVRLASEEDFNRVSVERISFLTSIKFKIEYRGDGTPYIKLSTNQPVTEPYLDFLIEARWARGRALKEYTVLVDPPVLAQDIPTAVEQVETAPVFAPPPQKAKPIPRQATRPTPAKRPAQQTQPQQRKPAARPIPSGPSGPLNYGAVKRNDTLWEIAEELRDRSGSDVSVYQMMMALLAANPNAFIDGNVNQVKAGYVLRIKDPEILSAMSRSEAKKEFWNQTTTWREAKSGRLVKQVEVAEADVSDEFVDEPETGSDRRSAADQAKLKLVAPGRDGLGAGGSAKDSAEARQVQEDLMLATEALDASRQEAEDLQTRSAELEEQLDSMQRLIMLKDEEMLAVQNQLDKQEDTATAPVDEPVADAPAEEADSGTSLIDYLMFGGVALLLVGIVAWLIIRRRKMQEGFEESILNVGMGSAAASSAAAFGVAATDSGESSMVSDFAMSDMGGIQSDAAEVDPISEADVYLAYGRHQQAEDIIKQAMETNPDRLELHAKLLEVYHAANNRAGFEPAAQVLNEKLGGDESNEYWQRIAPLGAELCPDSALFGGTMMAAAGDTTLAGNVGGVTAEEEDLLDFEFNEDLTSSVDTETAMETHDEADTGLDFDVTSLDFNLDEGLEDEALEAVDQVDDNALDFTLHDIDSGPDTISIEEAPTELNLTMAETEQMDMGALDFETGGADDAVETQDGGLELSLGDIENDDTLHASSNDLDMDLNLAETTEFALEDDAGLEAFGEEEDLGDDIFADVDEIGTKLDLAKAYVDMGDSDGARSILDEVMEEGDDSQKEQAQQLLQQMMG